MLQKAVEHSRTLYDVMDPREAIGRLVKDRYGTL
jgi:hypothetical protein